MLSYISHSQYEEVSSPSKQQILIASIITNQHWKTASTLQDNLEILNTKDNMPLCVFMDLQVTGFTTLPLWLGKHSVKTLAQWYTGIRSSIIWKYNASGRCNCSPPPWEGCGRVCVDVRRRGDYLWRKKNSMQLVTWLPSTWTRRK